MILILFFVAFAILIYLFVSTHRTVVVYQEPEPSWWSWPITSYNWWPYWNGRYASGTYGGSYSNGTVQHKGPRHTPHQESRPWGGASRYANASAPSKGHGGPSGGHGGSRGENSGGHSMPSGGSGGHGGGGHR